MQKHIRFITILTLFLLVGISFTQIMTPKALSADAPETAFSSARAIEIIEQIANAPHPTGSFRQAEVRDWLIFQLNQLGLNPEIHTTVGGWDTYGALGNIENIIVRIPGSDPTGAVLLIAHYDSVPAGPGATDNASGVAVMLETIRAISAGEPLKQDVIALFTDGEEVGLLGAQAFVKNHPWLEDVRLVINLEAAITGPAMLVEANPENGWIIREYAKTAPRPVSASWLYDLYNLLPYNTDYLPFKTLGIPGLNFMSINASPRYHSPFDDTAHLSAESIQHHGNQTLALINQFANNPLEVTKAPDKVFFNLLGPIMVHYPTALAIPLAALALLTFIFVLIYGFRKKTLHWKNILVSFLLFLGALIIVSGVVFALWQFILKLHPMYSARFVARHIYNELYYFAAAAGLALTAFSAAYPLFTRKRSLPEILAGCQIIWLIFAVTTSILLPGFSYLFIWGLLGSIVMLYWLLKNELSDLKEFSSAGYMMISLTSLPAVLTFVPFLYMLGAGLGTSAVMILPALTLVLLVMLLPYVDLLLSNGSKLLPLIALVISIIFLVIGSLTGSPTVERPMPNAMEYLYNVENEQAYWKDGFMQTEDEWVQQFFANEANLVDTATVLPVISYQIQGSLAPNLDLPQTEINIADDRVENHQRIITFDIQSHNQANQIQIYIDPAVDAVDYRFDNYLLDDKLVYPDLKPGCWKMLTFTNPVDGHLNFELRMTGDQPVSLWIVEHTTGLPDPQKADYTPRPETMMDVGDVTTIASYVYLD
jgi:hypothetical protein